MGQTTFTSHISRSEKSKIKVLTYSFPGKNSLPDLQTAVSSQGRERERESSDHFLFLQKHSSHHQGLTLKSSFKPNYLPKAPPPNIITGWWGRRAVQHINLGGRGGGVTNIQSTAIHTFIVKAFSTVYGKSMFPSFHPLGVQYHPIQLVGELEKNLLFSWMLLGEESPTENRLVPSLSLYPGDALFHVKWALSHSSTPPSFTGTELDSKWLSGGFLTIPYGFSFLMPNTLPDTWWCWINTCRIDRWLSFYNQFIAFCFLPTMEKRYFMLDISVPVNITFRNESLGTANRGGIVPVLHRKQG